MDLFTWALVVGVPTAVVAALRSMWSP